MTGLIERVCPGPASEEALSAVIQRAKAGDPLAPVTVVVSSATVALSLRRRLVDSGPVAGVRFTEMTRLIELIGSRRIEEGTRRPLTAAATLAAARVALAEAPGLLGPVAGHPATAASLSATYRAVRAAGHGRLEPPSSAGALAGDVAGLTERMRSRLEAGHYDLRDLTEAATDALQAAQAHPAGGSFLGADVGFVVVYLPAPMSSPVLCLLSVMADEIPVVVLAGCTGDALADRGVDRFVEELTGSGSFEVTYQSPGRASGSARASFAMLVNVPDEDEEARSAIRLLLAHAEAGGDLGRCIVTYPAAAGPGGVSGVADRVCRQLDEAGVPWSGPRRQLLSERPHGRLLLSLVDLAMPTQTGRELDRGDVMRFLSSGPILLGRGLTAGLRALGTAPGERGPDAGDERGGDAGDERPAELSIGAWDRCSREAGVVSGIEEWRTRLGGFADRLRERAPGSASADHAADLYDVVVRLFDLVSAAAACVTWEELTDWCISALGELLEPGEALDELEDALADLDSLDAVEPLAALRAAERLDHFRDALAAALDRPSGRAGRYGVGPTVGPLGAMAGCRAELLLVLGCREGELPARRRDDPLLPRCERALVDPAEPESGEEEDRRHLVSLIAASERAIALFARIDVASGRRRYRSRWLDNDLLTGPGTEVPSFARALDSVASGALPAASETDYELAALSTAAGGETFGDVLGVDDTDYGRRLHVERDRAVVRTGLSRFAGYLGQPADQLWRDVHSATALEDFAACPLRFFFSHLLNLRHLDAPERVPTIEARERGSLVHAVLERFFAPEGERRGAIPVLDAAARERLEEIAREECQAYEDSGKTGKRLNWDIARDQILRDLRLFVAIEVRRAQAGQYVPQAVELCFGRREVPPLVVQAAGREVKFSGQIDRVDRGPDGQVVVVDYKTGKADRFRDIAKKPLGRGGHLQLPLYAKAVGDVPRPDAVGPDEDEATASQRDWRAVTIEAGAPPVRAEYRFASAVAGFAIVPVELSDALDREFGGVLSTLVSTIDSGCFPPRPGELGWMNRYDNCAICDFNSVCTTDRADLWERASADERMRAYTDLVNGQDGDAP